MHNAMWVMFTETRCKKEKRLTFANVLGHNAPALLLLPSMHPSAWKVHSPKLIPVGSPLRHQRPLPGLLMDTPPYFPDEFFGLVRRK